MPVRKSLLPVPFSSSIMDILFPEDANTVLHSKKLEDTRLVSPEASVLISTMWIGSLMDNMVLASAILPASPTEQSTN